MSNSVNILSKTIDSKLYAKLIIQLNRDLLLGNIDLQINKNCQPENLVLMLNKLFINLIQKDAQSFNQFMYTLDVSEKKIKALTETKLDLLASQLSQLVLERILQKVILKQQFSNS